MAYTHEFPRHETCHPQSHLEGACWGVNHKVKFKVTWPVSGRGTSIRVGLFLNQSMVFGTSSSISTRSIQVSCKSTTSTLLLWIARLRMRYMFSVHWYSSSLKFHYGQDGEEKIPEPPSTDTAQGVLPWLIATLVNRCWQVKALMKDKSAPPKRIIQVQMSFLTSPSAFWCLFLASSTILNRWHCQQHVRMSWLWVLQVLCTNIGCSHDLQTSAKLCFFFAMLLTFWGFFLDLS